VLGLARDKDETVAAPVSRQLPVLTDDYLVSIIAEGAPGWVEQAIAGRDILSPALADTLIKQVEASAVARVIANLGSTLSTSALKALVERSATVTELQPPLVDRKNMPRGLLTKLVKFVALPLLKTLCGRKDLDQQSVSAINRAIESRDDKPGNSVAMAEFRDPSLDSETSTDATAEARVRQLFVEGSLTDDVVATALDGQGNEVVMAALALRAGYPVETIRRMVCVQSARTIVALSWKAEL